VTDARLRGEWLNSLQFDGLSDTAWRVFTGALMWSAENGTDGLIPKRYLKMLHPDGEQPAAFEEIVRAKLWTARGDGFQCTDWDGSLGQSSAEQVETYKANARKRSKDYRERERKKLARSAGFSPSPETQAPPVTRDVVSDVTRDVREHVGKGEGTGKGSGYSEVQQHEEIETVNPRTGEVVDINSGFDPEQLDYCVVCGRPLGGWPVARKFAICTSTDQKHEAARAA